MSVLCSGRRRSNTPLVCESQHTFINPQKPRTLAVGTWPSGLYLPLFRLRPVRWVTTATPPLPPPSVVHISGRRGALNLTSCSAIVGIAVWGGSLR